MSQFTAHLKVRRKHVAETCSCPIKEMTCRCRLDRVNHLFGCVGNMSLKHVLVTARATKETINADILYLHANLFSFSCVAAHSLKHFLAIAAPQPLVAAAFANPHCILLHLHASPTQPPLVSASMRPPAHASKNTGNRDGDEPKHAPRRYSAATASFTGPPARRRRVLGRRGAAHPQHGASAAIIRGDSGHTC